MEQNNKVSFDDTSVAFSHKSLGQLRKSQFLFSLMNREHLAKIGTYFVKTALRYKFPVENLIKKTLFFQFCGGESLEECKEVISFQGKYNIKTIPDYANEGESSAEGFEDTYNKIVNIVQFAGSNEYVPFIVFKISGLFSVNLLERIQNGEQLSKLENEDFTALKSKLENLCRLTEQCNKSIMIDAEESWFQGVTDALVLSLMNKFNKKRAVVYTTIQMYRVEALGDLKELHEIASRDKFYVGVKLVRGAYLDAERERALQRGYKSPVWDLKTETDEAFDIALQYCVENIEQIYVCSGTHNEQSNYHLIHLMENNNIAPDDHRIYFSQLYGMGDHISFNLAGSGYNVAKYVPFGPIKSALPYLFRRADENKSMMGQTGRELSLINKEIKRRQKS